MKLDIDCVRDILLAVEEKGFRETFSINDLKEITHYSSDQIEYTCFKLSEADYLDITTVTMSGGIGVAIHSVNELTYQGHEFLGNITSKKVFDKTKSICREIGIASLQGISKVAASVVTSFIQPK